MNKLLLNAALALVARLPWDDILQVLKAVAVRKLNVVVLEQIERLVAAVDAVDMKGAAKKQQVIDALLGENSPVRLLAAGAPGWLLGWAIDTAVLRLRTAGS
jgi:hypothetical protein